MKNQFFYTRKEPKALSKEGEAPAFNEYKDSFNLTLVIRSMELEDGRVLVALNDIHQRIDDTPILNKRNEITGHRNKTNTYQSEIFLSKEDGARFKTVTEV